MGKSAKNLAFLEITFVDYGRTLIFSDKVNSGLR